MQIKRHDRSHIVTLADGSEWRIWPGDTPNTLGWLPTTEIDVVRVEHKVCSHALVNRSDGSRVRVINANMNWPVHAVRQTLAGS
jgi:hypothetical protein